MPVSRRNKNNFNKANINSRFLSFFLSSLILLTIGLIIKINNVSEIIKRDEIPFLLKQINIGKDQKVIAINNRDRLIRTHIKKEAKKNGMIKADYSRNIIKW
tara:strand:- start:4570 stop:4875 length:306 start_codon:yes stop_codon:yes gene_type:complete